MTSGKSRVLILHSSKETTAAKTCPTPPDSLTTSEPKYRHAGGFFGRIEWFGTDTFIKKSP
ncbi:hypothetical protein [uncultured Desulfobacter sp.]|uniref:hypothetical protein n=1 Tax=uncultured Desulfobacter sp. TaxID=240139 RepID=UPI002AA72847|nr:hypothetical protein [uncultured Desulfobacter sp.]